ncbi:MAG: hypothetical protein ACRDSF_02500 [Pseudonocardiaceae bacterium]
MRYFVKDESGIEYGLRRGWALLTKDQKIRYRAEELLSLAEHGKMFCLRFTKAAVSSRNGHDRRPGPGRPRCAGQHSPGSGCTTAPGSPG